MKNKLLFLNPPGNKLYLRDYYCSKVSQANYLLPPIDFIFQSGFLKFDFELYFIDAIALNKKSNWIFNEIKKLKPDIIIFLSGAVSIDEDILFIKQLTNIFPKIQLVGTGDIFLDFNHEILEYYNFVEAFFNDFTSIDLLNYLKGERSNFSSLAWRNKQGLINFPILFEKTHNEFSLPTPLYSIFLNSNYKYPFIHSKQFCVLLNDFGCPFHCIFCVMPSLSFKIKKLELVKHDLITLKNNNINDLLILDQSFGFIKERTLIILEYLKYYKFNWICFSRIDLLDEKLIISMRDSGCNAIIFGIESGSNNIQDYIGKKFSKNQIINIFTLCKKHNIKTIATFVLGLPPENHETIKETWQLINEIKPDYASYNVAVPRLNTFLRKDALKYNLINKTINVLDQSGIKEIPMPSKYLSKKDIAYYRIKSVRKFYLRSYFLFNEIRKINNFYSLYNIVSQGIKVLKNSIASILNKV